MNFENENNLVFEFISPYRINGNSFYVLLFIDISSNENFEEEINENFLINNWQNFVFDYNLPPVENFGKKQRVEIYLNESEEENERIYLLALISDNQLINWIPDFND